MKNLSRRDLCATLPALALFAEAFAHAQTPVAGPVKSLTTDADTLPAHSCVYDFNSLPTSKNPTGAITHNVMHGNLPTGEYFEMHETTLGPGEAPHPPHHHIHSEWMLLRTGSVEFSMGDNTATVGPGGICYAHSGETHGLKNTGTVPANYFVIAVGKEPA